MLILARDSMVVSSVIRNYPIEIHYREYLVDQIVIEFKEFNLILDMD